jgi:two-component system chemotaxis response regulator CheY
MRECTHPSDRTVMIADDTSFSRERLKGILTRWGYTVVAEAVNGLEAVAKYCELRPGITFMNIIMPIKSGLDATKEIVTFDGNAKVVICSMSGHDSLLKAAVEAGAFGMVFKPFRAEEVMELLEAALDGQG